MKIAIRFFSLAFLFAVSATAQSQSKGPAITKGRLLQMQSSVSADSICRGSEQESLCRLIVQEQVTSCARGLVTDNEAPEGTRRRIKSDAPLGDGGGEVVTEPETFFLDSAEAETAFSGCIARALELAALDTATKVRSFYNTEANPQVEPSFLGEN